jgi:hypothetical protein
VISRNKGRNLEEVAIIKPFYFTGFAVFVVEANLPCAFLPRRQRYDNRKRNHINPSS